MSFNENTRGGNNNLHSNMVLLKLDATIERVTEQRNLHSNMVLLK